MAEIIEIPVKNSLEEYQDKIDIESTVGFVIVLIFFLSVIGFTSALRKKNGVKNNRTTRYERLLNSPDINTNNYGLHNKRLEIHGRSKYSGTTFYVGAKGGVYYISSRGTRVY